jgi:hypothetical protein
MGLDETSGISLGYGQQTEKATPDAEDDVTTQINLSYAKTMGMVKFVGGYFSQSEKTTPDADATVNTWIALGMVASF